MESNPLNLLVIKEIDEEQAKQTHCEYFLMFQWLRVAWRPNFRER